MNLPRSFSRLFSVLCCAVLLCAQAAGMARGYLCGCSGKMEWSAQDHCHGPHDGSCDDETVTPLGHQEHDGLGERRDHQQIRDVVESLRVASLAAPEMVPFVVVLLDENFGARAFEPARWAGIANDLGEAPPPGVAVARTVVLLI